MLPPTQEEDAFMKVDGGFSHYFNHSSKHRQKARTLQPDGRMYVMHKYFQTTTQMPLTYENVSVKQDHLGSSMFHQTNRVHHTHHHLRQASRHSHISHQHSHHHDRSHSQHEYQPMVQGPSYYNVVQPNTIRSRHSPVHEPDRPAHNQPAQLDCITVMQVCNDLGNIIDASPSMPPPRNYTVCQSQDLRDLARVDFPQTRYMRNDLTDKFGRKVKAGEPITVLGPSKEDRSKFTICYKDILHFDVPHQFTKQPQVCLNLGYGQGGYIHSHNLTMRHRLADQVRITNSRK